MHVHEVWELLNGADELVHTDRLIYRPQDTTQSTRRYAENNWKSALGKIVSTVGKHGYNGGVRRHGIYPCHRDLTMAPNGYEGCDATGYGKPGSFPEITTVLYTAPVEDAP